MRASSIPLAIASWVAVFAASGALAQPPAPPSPQVIQQVYACADIADTTARLACYDAAVTAMKTAQTGGQFAAVDAAGVRRLEREAFGFSMPSLPRLGLPGFTRGSAEAALGPTDEVAMTIRRVGRSDGHRAFTMENGQVWLAIEDMADNPRAKPGAAVEIRRASMGSYLMSFGGGAALRVRRAE